MTLSPKSEGLRKRFHGAPNRTAGNQAYRENFPFPSPNEANVENFAAEDISSSINVERFMAGGRLFNDEVGRP